MDTKSILHVGERLANLAFIGPETGTRKKKGMMTKVVRLAKD